MCADFFIQCQFTMIFIIIIFSRKQQLTSPFQRLILTGFYQQLKYFWSCSSMNCCLQNILCINLDLLYILYVKT